ncbi:MAG: hypothetical protein EOM54_13860 [Clostridia bacterium]|nr:hypothetical protein [Clostridia bacterium]
MTAEKLSHLFWAQKSVEYAEKELEHLARDERAALDSLQHSSEDVELIRHNAKLAYLIDPAYIKKRTDEIVITATAIRTSINARKEQNQREIDEIMRWIDEIEDESLRTLFVLKYSYAWTYPQIATAVAPGSTPDALRVRCLRYIHASE